MTNYATFAHFEPYLVTFLNGYKNTILPWLSIYSQATQQAE